MFENDMLEDSEVSEATADFCLTTTDWDTGDGMLDMNELWSV
ncbi:hypothetical protein ACFS7Z_26775 [Pontibacter toksunensis]|uniref:Uncharacterized protein n=1 Tax=Pontibacter toksunensis TaxID=1332631 RepID=A0ABW6C1Q2_9BACT